MSDIKYIRRRGDSAYLTIDGQPARATFTWPYAKLELNYKTRKSETYKSLMLAPDRRVYRDDLREWSDDANTYFYPFASDDEVKLFDAAMDAIPPAK